MVEPKGRPNKEPAQCLAEVEAEDACGEPYVSESNYHVNVS
jgi:hypothetical protein